MSDSGLVAGAAPAVGEYFTCNVEPLVPSRVERIYIAGPMTGRRRETVLRHFGQAKAYLEMLGFAPISPLEIPGLEGVSDYRTCMEGCARTLIREAEGIFLLRGWENSKGATAELHLARSMRLTELREGEGSRYVARAIWATFATAETTRYTGVQSGWAGCVALRLMRELGLSNRIIREGLPQMSALRLHQKGRQTANLVQRSADFRDRVGEAKRRHREAWALLRTFAR